MAIILGRKAPRVQAKGPAAPVAAAREPVERRQVRQADHTLQAGQTVVDLADPTRVGRTVRVYVPVGASVMVPTSGKASPGQVIFDAGTSGEVQWRGDGWRRVFPYSQMRGTNGARLPHVALVEWSAEIGTQVVPVGNLGLLAQQWQPRALPDTPQIIYDVTPRNEDGTPDYAAFAGGYQLADRQRTVDRARAALGAAALPNRAAPGGAKSRGGGGGGGGLLLGAGALVLKLLKGKR